MDERAKGLIALISACTIWGLSAIYYKTMTHIAPLEILGHRTLWSLVFFTAVLVLQGRAREILTALGSPRQFGLMALAGVLIATNWGFFILSVQMGRVVEASFGYYIFPLVAVALGAVFLGERLRPAQWISVSLALGAVVVLSVAQGIVPLISLILAGSFGVYGLIKRVIKVGPVVSVTCEVAILAPLAMIYLVGAHFWDWSGGAAQVGGVFGHAWRDSLLLMFSGVITGGPLILFSYGARRLALATTGLVQYLNPSLQFLLAVFLFSEPFTGWHILSFALIWSALTIYSVVAIIGDKSSFITDSNRSTDSTTVI